MFGSIFSQFVFEKNKFYNAQEIIKKTASVLPDYLTLYLQGEIV